MSGAGNEAFLWKQWIGGVAAMLTMFTEGLMGGWASPFLARLKMQGSPFYITEAQSDWVASCLSLGRCFGAILGAVCLQYTGTKKTLLLNGFSMIFSWICLIVADSAPWLYAARFSGGIGLGVALGCFPLYLGEISSPEIRGALVCLASFGMPTGIFIGNTMGPYLSMSTFSYIGLIPNILFILIFFRVPESPHHLARVNKMDAAKKSIVKYNPVADKDTEADRVRDFVSATGCTTFGSRVKQLNVPCNRRAFVILMAVNFFVQFSGFPVVTVYAEIILTRAKLTVIHPSTMVIILGAVGVPTGFLSMYISDKCGRKMMMTTSSLGTGMAMTALGVHFALLSAGYDPLLLQWLPIASFLFYQTFLSLGLVSIPNIVLSELFAADIKSLTGCCSSLAAGIFAFSAIRLHSVLVHAIGDHYVCWSQAIVMVVSLMCALTVIPETKGKTLQEIQKLLDKN